MLGNDTKLWFEYMCNPDFPHGVEANILNEVCVAVKLTSSIESMGTLRLATLR